MNSEKNIKESIKNILSFLGEDPSREGLKDTPGRMIDSWKKIFGGYQQTPEDVFTIFKEDDVIPFNQIILLKDIDFFFHLRTSFPSFLRKSTCSVYSKR